MWKHYQPTNIQFGAGGTETIAEQMRHLGVKKAWIICDPFAEDSGLAKRIVELSEGLVTGISSDVEPNPSIQNVDTCAAAAKNADVDCILALGGGSAMDCGKAVAASIACNLDGAALLAGGRIDKALPIIAIPTTAGTGSEVTAGAVLSDKIRGVKGAIFSPVLFPKLAVVDSELTHTCPPAVTASSGIDALMHALDAMCSVKSNPVTDALAVKAARMALHNLTRAYADGTDKKAREGMAMASVIAGLAFSQTGTTGSHACSYILTAKYHMPHGEACAFTADSWFRINARVRPELDDFASELGFDDANGLADEINRLKRHMGMRMTLQQADIDVADLDEIVQVSMASGNMANNIARINEDDLRMLFKVKMNGQ